jgi:hypothetical protein
VNGSGAPVSRNGGVMSRMQSAYDILNYGKVANEGAERSFKRVQTVSKFKDIVNGTNLSPDY